MPTTTPDAPSAKRGRDPAAVGDPAGREHRHGYRVDDLRDQREGADERVLGGSQERDAVTGSLRAARDDRVDSDGIERDGLGDGRRGRDDADAAIPRPLDRAPAPGTP